MHLKRHFWFAVQGSEAVTGLSDPLFNSNHPIDVANFLNATVQLVDLDIQSPDENGFDVLKSLSTLDFEVIFVTGFEQYGVQASRFPAMDYPLKLIDPQELQHAVARAGGRLNRKTKRSAAQPDALLTASQ